MKKITILLGILFCAATTLFAQKDYKVVFDLTSKDTMEHKKVIRWLNEITKEVPVAQLEVVFYGMSLDMIKQGSSTVAADVQRLAGNPNVSFKVCQVAMKKHNIENGQLIAGVQTVPDGIYEIIKKQREGWGYIKVAP
jgi:intracellular sulfur oxidation DsrE/DsrF family protein